MSNALLYAVLNNTFVDPFSNNAVPQCLVFSFFFRMIPLIIDYVGTERIIKDLKISSSAGVDNLNSKLLKNTKEYSTFLYNSW